MLQYIKTYKDIVVFSQWSRKSYAAFASLNKIVSIAYLSMDLYLNTLLKKVALSQFLSIMDIDNYKRIYCNIIKTLNNSSLLLVSLAVKSEDNDIYNLVKVYKK